MFRLLVFAALLAALPAAAQEAKREYIYGGELMSAQERAQYRKQVAGAKGSGEQARVRQQHRERMQKRARERGVALDERGVIGKK